jgi:hypothetical protein
MNNHSDAAACCIHHQGALMMEAASTSETSVNLYLTTRRNIAEDSHLHICSSRKDSDGGGT